jgi:hypothetical protein
VDTGVVQVEQLLRPHRVYEPLARLVCHKRIQNDRVISNKVLQYQLQERPAEAFIVALELDSKRSNVVLLSQLLSQYEIALLQGKQVNRIGEPHVHYIPLEMLVRARNRAPSPLHIPRHFRPKAMDLNFEDVRSISRCLHYHLPIYHLGDTSLVPCHTGATSNEISASIRQVGYFYLKNLVCRKIRVVSSVIPDIMDINWNPLRN